MRPFVTGIGHLKPLSIQIDKKPSFDLDYGLRILRSVLGETISVDNQMPLRKVLIIGPLPPPHGGATVSFERFLKFASQRPGVDVHHINLPVQKQIKEERPQRISYTRTFLRLIGVLTQIGRYESVVFFASRGSAFSYGLLIILASAARNRPIYIRLFGGRPFLRARARSNPMRAATHWVLGKTARIVVETSKAREDFPEQLRNRVVTVTGYRSAIEVATEVKTADPNRPFRFAFVGRVELPKGIDTLIQAAATMSTSSLRSSFEIDCYGHASDEVRALLEEQTKVQLMGVVPHTELMTRLTTYDAFVYPSRYDNEGHPGAVIEAMLAGLPIICTDLETVVEIVHHEINGLVVPMDDPKALAVAMTRLVNDPNLLAKLRVGAQSHGVKFDERLVLPELAATVGL